MPPARESLAVSGSSGQIPAGATIGGRFRIEGVFAQDTVSQTYRAQDLSTGNGAAVRIIPMRVLGAAAPQLETDIENAAALVHKNLVEVLSVGRESDFFYVATELLDGQTLRDFIDAKRREGRTVSFKGACNLITHIANGLERAAASMPHGGLNPAAIWVSKSGRVKVADLGLPRTLPMLARRGAPDGGADESYVAPEVLGGRQATLASDVYSLGIVLYEVLTGRLPSAPLRPPSEMASDVPADVDAILGKALARDPSNRFRSPPELRQALASVQAGAGSGVATSTSSGLAGSGLLTAPAMNAVPAAPQPSQSPSQISQPAAPDPQALRATGRSTFGRSFNVADAAGGAIDEAQERWLIQKDKLDFGPFSLAQIRAQIERGDIIGDHMIVDSDTGARKKVKDFAGLGDFARTSERRIEQMRRAHAEVKHEAKEKAKSAFTMIVVLIALVGVIGGVGYYVWSRKAQDKTQMASREEEAEIDSFLKSVKLSFVAAKAAKRGSGGSHRGSVGGATNDGDFSNDANFGDASKHGSGGDDVLDDQLIEETMMKHYRGLVPCLMQARRGNPGLTEMSLDFVIRGTGKVSAVKVNGQKSGAFASCVLNRMPAFPKFNGNRTIASWSMSMR
jgi:eukaryotic-like serine/threonine-protein kinase